MCLLVTQSKDVVFDDHFLKGVYQHNSDGIGVMYSENNTLHIKRSLPKNESQFISFFRKEIEGRDCSWHARMRTHGDINFENCHPYKVIGSDEGYPLYLAHNGVLHTGNAKDLRKSDTWHYIQDFLRPMLLKNPEFFMTEAFSELIGDHIGSNRFVLMDGFGNMVTINKSQGVEYNGAWLSNTYAWDTTGTPFEKPYSRRLSRGYSAPMYPWFSWGYDDDDEKVVTSKVSSFRKDEKQEEEEEEKKKQEKVADLPEDIDFACEFFEAMRDLKFDDSDIDWDDAIQYFNKSGTTLAYDFLATVITGGYTETEIFNEITQYREKSSPPAANLQLEASATS